MMIGGVMLLVAVRFWRYSVPLDLEVVGIAAVVVLLGTVLSYTLYLQGVPGSWSGPCQYDLLCRAGHGHNLLYRMAGHSVCAG